MLIKRLLYGFVLSVCFFLGSEIYADNGLDPVNGSCGLIIGNCFDGNSSYVANSTCGVVQNRTCIGFRGGTTASCSGTIPCATAGVCNNTVAGGCASGTITGDNNQTTCGTTRRRYCDGPSGGAQSSQCSFVNPTCVGNATCGIVTGSYTSGLYTGQWTQLLSASGVVPLFCSAGLIAPSFSLLSNNLTRGCGSSSCTIGLRSNQPTACAIGSTAGSKLITLASTGVCMVGPNHTDPSITGNIKVLSVLGGGQLDWTWTCGGDYHNSTVCSTPSLGACGVAGSGGTQSFSSLSSTDSTLCANGVVTGFNATGITISPFYTAQYRRGCLGSTSSPSSCSAYQSAPLTPGVCNVGVHGQSLLYNQIKDAYLCTQGRPSVMLLSPIPNTGSKRTWSCEGLGGGTSASCSANAITNGICNTFTSSQLTIPSNPCVSGTPTTISSITGSYQWTCNGTNGGISSNLCSAPCAGSICAMTSSGTTTTTTGTTTTTTTTGSNGQTTPISFNLVCTDPDGCVCYNVTIVNGSRCLANNFTGVSDSIITPISVGTVCTDADGCLCNSLNTIVNGAICQTDGLTGYLPGAADLSVYQSVTSGTISRRGQIDITINYINRGPNIATGARLEYYLSPLVSKIRTSAPYSFVQTSTSGYIQSSEYQNNVLVFSLGNVAVGENGSVVISLTLNANLTDKELTNATSIASRVQDAKPLDNAQKMIFGLDTQTATNLGNYIINPLLSLQQIMQQYITMNDRLRIDPVFSDIQKGKDSYMSVMTVVRNGIFEGYQYNRSRKFEPDKCSTRIEAINVLARMMYNAGSTDVYVSRPSGTAYIDANVFSLQTQNFINRGHERGLISLLQPKNIKGTLYLEPNRVITQGELKNMINAIYTRYGLDTTILDDLLKNTSSCLTRLDFADTVTTILRGNPNIMMGYNDDFIKTIINKTHLMSIIDRRAAIQKVINKLQATVPTLLYENGYDAESLLDILESSMDGREYNPITSSSYSVIKLAQTL